MKTEAWFFSHEGTQHRDALVQKIQAETVFTSMVETVKRCDPTTMVRACQEYAKYLSVQVTDDLQVTLPNADAFQKTLQKLTAVQHHEDSPLMQ